MAQVFSVRTLQSKVHPHVVEGTYHKAKMRSNVAFSRSRPPWRAHSEIYLVQNVNSVGMGVV